MKYLLTIFITGMLFFIISGCGDMPSRISTKADFYVSVNGNDSWSGTLPEPNTDKSDGPFATIEQGRDAIREMKTNKEISRPLTVMLRGGTYFLDKTVVFGPEDSGTEECPVNYKAYPDEVPVISGGRKIEASWDIHDGNIMVCNIPEAEQGEWHFNQLFVNGERQTRARIPHEGYLFYEEVIADSAIRYMPGDWQRWQNLEDVQVVVFHSWNASRLKVAKLNEEGGYC